MPEPDDRIGREAPPSTTGPPDARHAARGIQVGMGLDGVPTSRATRHASSTARSGKRALPDPVQAVRIADPKRLRRFLDEVLTPPALDGVGPSGRASLEAAFEEFGQEHGIRAIAWYTEEGPCFVRRGVSGLGARFAERLGTDVAAQLMPGARRVRVFRDEAAPTSPAALALVVPGPSAAIRFDHPPHQLLALVALDPTADVGTVEFLLGTIASALSARTLQERWRRSLAHAAEIQRGLLPRTLPELPSLEIAATSIACDDVGGDLFDFFPFGADTLGVAVGDASGHGLPAALVARDVVVGLRVGLDRGMRIGGVLARLNRVLRAGIPEGAFASLFYAEVHVGGVVEYVSAGHPPALRVGADGYTALRQGGPVLGPVEKVSYRRTSARLEVGETLVLYSDGITERRSPGGDLYGEERLAADVAAAAGQALASTLAEVVERVRAFGGGAPWGDDLTLVLLRRRDPPSSPAGPVTSSRAST